ncbi:hypothetical protein CHRY9390_01850 [Chryseobacterium aquaeductus]|uniref:Uncharacterized protein n=1 Tax=Chryseobacterium aquaeductus TaxID=2675056 RepID=A0A9N8MNV4_9FLAO|nr:hypothetical protein [Chryseobacterium aquaeductus]CAA7331163.1 hypothetical protein CHRY9390_01850 [Chryseobacterium potabilaquae]CAD7808556.1 hypothetical protein CHRY9390_01850 [Chryseobacterium aquaeductus]
MMTNIQEREVRAFLQKKKLSIVVLNEIYDHFVVQISELMRDGMFFQEAFLKTKLDWQYELEMVKADVFSFKKIARIEKKVLQDRFRNITLYAIIATVAAFILDLVNFDLLLFAVLTLGGITFCLLLYNFIFKTMCLREYICLQFHPLIIRNQLLAVILFGVSYAVNQNPYFWEPSANHVFMIFTLTIQIQLLYFRTKKINILLS